MRQTTYSTPWDRSPIAPAIVEKRKRGGLHRIHTHASPHTQLTIGHLHLSLCPTPGSFTPPAVRSQRSRGERKEAAGGLHTCVSTHYRCACCTWGRVTNGRSLTLRGGVFCCWREERVACVLGRGLSYDWQAAAAQNSQSKQGCLETRGSRSVDSRRCIKMEALR